MAQPGSPSHSTGTRWLPATAFDPLSVAVVSSGCVAQLTAAQPSTLRSRAFRTSSHFEQAVEQSQRCPRRATGNNLGAALSRGPDSHIWIKALPMTWAVSPKASAHALLDEHHLLHPQVGHAQDRKATYGRLVATSIPVRSSRSGSLSANRHPPDTCARDHRVPLDNTPDARFMCMDLKVSTMVRPWHDSVHALRLGILRRSSSSTNSRG
jgi:hypothetical protein